MTETKTDILSPDTVAQLRDAGPKDLVWLLCDSHEALRADAELSNSWVWHWRDRAAEAEAKVKDLEDARDELLAAGRQWLAETGPQRINTAKGRGMMRRAVERHG